MPNSLISSRYLGVACALTVIVLLLLPARAHPQESGSRQQMSQMEHWQTLVQADQRFAQLTTQAGRRAAFLEFLASDSVVFRDGPVDALTLYSSPSFAEAASEIDWKAHYVDVSYAGDVGLSAGPLTVFNDTGTDSYGHLISIWRSSSAGWELMADIVVNIPGFLSLDVEPNYSDTLPVIAETANPISMTVAENTLQSLVDADELFGRSINFRGGQRALLRYGLENTRVYLPGMGPAVGAEAASSVYGAFLDNQLATTNPINLNNVGAYLSSSREMGYTYGTMETDSDAAEAGFRTSYMRLWRFNQEGEWRIAVEVLSPF
ncbi:MAG: hypothetical protein O3A23_07180 [Proteobacteria bacterium]|nr:hypothetical protein [Pseudomonadota bacterium]